ncbi:MAG TPA: hypothetical protein PK156_51630, partial [Polyangium sp.]|nr:hypothetical protein [Polyangium sp.]
ATVDTAGRVGEYASLEIGSGGKFHVSYSLMVPIPNTTTFRGNLRYATRPTAAASWTLSTLETVGDVGLYTSIAVANGGDAHIGYYDKGNTDARHFYQCP